MASHPCAWPSHSHSTYCCRSESYNTCTALWGLLTRLVDTMYNNNRAGVTARATHWAAHQRFFRSMCMAGKVGGGYNRCCGCCCSAAACCCDTRAPRHICCPLPSSSHQVDELVAVAQQALADGMCVVVGLQSTGEAGTKQQMQRAGERDLDEL